MSENVNLSFQPVNNVVHHCYYFFNVLEKPIIKI